MANDGNRIWAPVSPDDVSEVLGVNSYDTGTLCRSDEVNPHSLIGPVYVTDPAIGPESFPTGLAGPHPGNGTDWGYELKRWGFYVPFVGNPADIRTIEDKPWVRNRPSGNSYDCLTHFDGYQHNAEPSLPVSAEIIAGKPIVLSLWPGNRQTVLSANGRANPGGVVAPYEVLGAVRIGCTLFKGNQVKGKWISEGLIGQTDLEPIVIIVTTETAEPNATYTIIPWATNANIDSNGNIVVPEAGVQARFYTLNFSEDFAGAITVQVPLATVAMANVTMQKVGTPLSMVKFHMDFVNQFATAQTVRNFRLLSHYDSISGTVKKEVELTGSTPVTIPANSSGAVSIDLSTTNSEILQNFNSMRSLVIYASWNSPSGLRNIQSPELAGYETGGQNPGVVVGE